ncbi:hypothetical protein YC2023_001747 [Brassica napus]
MKCSNTLGVMIVRGDLAVECGWEILDNIQEIIDVCKVASVQVILAEITDEWQKVREAGLETSVETSRKNCYCTLNRRRKSLVRERDDCERETMVTRGEGEKPMVEKKIRPKTKSKTTNNPPLSKSYTITPKPKHGLHKHNKGQHKGLVYTDLSRTKAHQEKTVEEETIGHPARVLTPIDRETCVKVRMHHLPPESERRRYD